MKLAVEDDTPARVALAVVTPEELRAMVREEMRVVLREERAATKAPPLNQLLSVDDAARALNTSASTIRRLVSVGRLRATKLSTGGSSRLRIPRSEVERARVDGELDG